MMRPKNRFSWPRQWVHVDDATVGYRKETFLKGSTLAKAMKKFR